MAIVGLLGTVYAVKQLSAQAAPCSTALRPALVGVGPAGRVLPAPAPGRRSRSRPEPVQQPRLHGPAAGERARLRCALRHPAAGRPVPAGGPRYVPAPGGPVDHPQRGGLRPRRAARAPARSPPGHRAAARRWSRRFCPRLRRSSPPSAPTPACSSSCRQRHLLLGLAPVYQVTTESAVAAVPAEQAGVAGATLETITNLGGALGIALFGSLAGAVYRAGTADTGVDTQTIGDALAQAAAPRGGPPSSSRAPGGVRRRLPPRRDRRRRSLATGSSDHRASPQRQP